MRYTAISEQLCQSRPLWFSFFIGVLSSLCGNSLLAQTNNLTGSDNDSAEAYFESHIRPILIEHCLECHSSEVGKTSGGLALDHREGWTLGGDSGPAIIPGDTTESLLLRAIGYEDEVLQMPPAEAGGKLSNREIELLTTWVKQGAYDPRRAESKLGGMRREDAVKWWAFQPVQNPELPVVDADWMQSPIDRFIRRRQLEAQISPNAIADKRTLLRRATLDLTGLPPTLEEIHEFESDHSKDAFDKVIDRLLQAPAYGERWGRHWLDVARYADTAGDGADYPVREAYRYRDWVIDAFRRDLPINQFLQQQIAGDLMAMEPPVSSNSSQYADHITATGFLAIGKRYGYAPNPDYQHLDFADVIDSVGRSMLGLSIGCARCHDHKYDPITMSDYYAWYGIMQSTKWSFPGGEEHKRPAHFPPLVPPAEAIRLQKIHEEKLASLDNQIGEVKQSRLALNPNFRAGGIDLDFEQQTPGTAPANAWLSSGPNTVLAEAQSPYTDTHPLGSRGVRIGTGKPNDGVRYVFEMPVQREPVKREKEKKIYFNIDFRAHSEEGKEGAFRFYLGRGVIASTALDCSATSKEFAVKNGTKWDVVSKLEPGRWYSLHLTLEPDSKTYSGQLVSGDVVASFEQKALQEAWDGVIDTFICDALGHVEGPAPSHDLDNIGLSKNPLMSTKGSGPTDENISPQIISQDGAEVEKQLALLDQRLKELQAERDRQAAQFPYDVAYGVSEGKPVDVAIQKRGEPDKLGEVVSRRSLEILGATPVANGDKESGRRSLATWISSDTNPLTARVFVNRVWKWHFGDGLVATPSDFGTRGAPPTHPELLDWLTNDFIKSGWSLKRLHRMIMTSRVYQLSSVNSSQGSAVDPDNRMYWKFKSRALEAEVVRDVMLALSGRLQSYRPAPHPFPDVNTWGFTIHNPFHAVYESEQRSVYLMIQRNRRHPYLSLFDGADPNQSTDGRVGTVTPNQSLYLMNSEFMHQQADAFAKRIQLAGKDDASRVAFAIEYATGMRPDDKEILEGVEFIGNSRQMYNRNGLASDGSSDLAWNSLARVLLSSNSILYIE